MSSQEAQTLTGHGRSARSRGLQYVSLGACGIGGGDRRPGLGAALFEDPRGYKQKREIFIVLRHSRREMFKLAFLWPLPPVLLSYFHSPNFLLLDILFSFKSTEHLRGQQRTDNSVERRLQKELMSLMKEPPPGVTVDGDQASQNLTLWTVHMEGVPGTLYEGEKFVLQFKFTNKYPFDSPEKFQGTNKLANHQRVVGDALHLHQSVARLLSRNMIFDGDGRASEVMEWGMAHQN
ncbi:Ubiquitin-conjugating enzyme E2 W [Eumeta japonica]|uniref:Ubiquitin-conjugating enzyme E2 W n=1 Tax=Eumeta variegata TaxID=151549 RepID=A0A4C1TZL6_EUMVA|nr:Ubiquitin-conjugating enzyme E2 W [Eumeta japonica]